MGTSSDMQMPVERFAELNAEIDAGATPGEVLAREQLSEEAWEETKQHWLSRMAEESERRRFEITNRYTTVFKAHRAVASAKRAMKKPPVAPSPAARPVPPPVPSAPATEPTPDVRPRIETVAPAVVAAPPVPRVWREPIPVSEPAPLTVPPATEPEPTTQPTPDDKAHRATPFQPATPFKPATPAPVPPAPVPPAPVPSAPVPPSPVLPSPVRVQKALEPLEASEPAEAGTMVASVMNIPAGTLPFALKSTTTPTKPGEPGAAPASALPFAPTTKRATGANALLSGTLFAVSPFVGAPLPFKKDGPAAAGAKPAPAHPVAMPPVRPERGQKMTAALPAFVLPPEGMRFSLEQFASLSAEIAHAPSQVDDLRGRYGVTADQHREEAAKWRAKFDADPRLAERFTTLVHQYKAYLDKRGPGR
jgi:hypothetical protein